MIVSFRHKGLEEFFKTGKSSKINPNHWERLNEQLTFLNVMPNENVIRSRPEWNPHRLSGKDTNGRDVNGYWSIWVSKTWRLTYTFENGNVVLLDYINYH